ncbi:MAG: MFS transporter [Pseudomonadota bacterium]
MAEKSDWRAILSAFLVGVAGAIQVGRVAPVATFIQDDLQLDLSAIGWLVSLITLASASLGLIAGYWVVRAGLRTSLVIGAAAMGACAVVAALGPTLPILVGARVVEGLGYLVVVVAAPTLIAREATERDTSFALALWGTFFTLGLSIAAFAGGALVGQVGWQGWFFGSAAIAVLAAMAALVSIPKEERIEVNRSNVWKTVTEMPLASWLLGAAFLGLTLLALSILSLLPTFLVQEHGFAPGTAGSVTGFVALASIMGSLGYGGFANRFPDTVIAAVASTALIVSAFVAFADATPLQIVTFAAVAVLMSGVLVAQTFATVPRVAHTPHLVGPTNGLVAQLGSVGALTGPPMIGALITFAGWSAVPWVVAGFALSFAALFILALKSQNTSFAKDVG